LIQMVVELLNSQIILIYVIHQLSQASDILTPARVTPAQLETKPCSGKTSARQ